jgi:DNA primase
MAVTPKTIAAIKAAPLSALIEATGAQLKRVGHEFLTQCLWHDDTNPSLTVNDDKGFCFCHVCRGGGDAIDYVVRRHGLSWREAAETAAQLLGVGFETDDENAEERAFRNEQRKVAIAALQTEQDAFKANLRAPQASRIRGLLQARGITAEAAREFGIGFSSKGFFEGRITLPIYNHRSELVGWTGRATREGQPAKYKNTESNDLFDKKSLVFNEVRAKEAAREAGSIIFVEGHLDVVSMWQAGIRNVVAMQGTGAPDPLVLQRLTRNIKTIILCYDGDAGGRKATEQFIKAAGPMALQGQLNLSVAILPEGSDPDEVIRGGGDLYSYLANAESWLDWVIDTWAAALDKTDTAMVTDVEQKLRTLIDSLRSKALRTHYVDKAARVLTSSEKEAEKLAKDWGNGEFFASESEWIPRAPSATRIAAERRLLRLFVHRPELRANLLPLMELVQHPALRWLTARLKELQEYCPRDLTPHSVMAVVVVAEPHYMEQLRTLIQPNVIVNEDQEVIDHLAVILEDEVLFSANDEPDPNQPSA